VAHPKIAHAAILEWDLRWGRLSEERAKILGMNQAAVSKLEQRADMYVSTLQSFVKAMGGELKITARFPEGTVEINQFEDVKKAAGE
jgi:Helix-turn-helix domain